MKRILVAIVGLLIITLSGCVGYQQPYRHSNYEHTNYEYHYVEPRNYGYYNYGYHRIEPRNYGYSNYGYSRHRHYED